MKSDGKASLFIHAESWIVVYELLATDKHVVWKCVCVCVLFIRHWWRITQTHTADTICCCFSKLKIRDHLKMSLRVNFSLAAWQASRLKNNISRKCERKKKTVQKEAPSLCSCCCVDSGSSGSMVLLSFLVCSKAEKSDWGNSRWSLEGHVAACILHKDLCSGIDHCSNIHMIYTSVSSLGSSSWKRSSDEEELISKVSFSLFNKNFADVSFCK